MTLLPNSLHARDVAYRVHPNARRHERVGPMILERGEGIHVSGDQGCKASDRRGRDTQKPA